MKYVRHLSKLDDELCLFSLYVCVCLCVYVDDDAWCGMVWYGVACMFVFEWMFFSQNNRYVCISLTNKIFYIEDTLYYTYIEYIQNLFSFNNVNERHIQIYQSKLMLFKANYYLIAFNVNCQ